ncbi:MAG: YoaK family protein [Solirubrobacteraceae bacterium]
MRERQREPAARHRRADLHEHRRSPEEQGRLRARALLTALALAAGCSDAVTYVSLGHVFTANMTGNTVLLGIAIIAGSAVGVARSACAVVGFCLGVALAARGIGARRGRLWSRRVTIALLAEALTLAALASWAAVLGTAGSQVYWMIALSGVAMGAQSAAVQAVAIPGVATTYITGTLTGAVAAAAAGTGKGETQLESPATQRLAAAIWITYLAAAIAGAAGARVAGAQAIWIAAAAVVGVVGVAFRHRHALATPAPSPDLLR